MWNNYFVSINWDVVIGTVAALVVVLIDNLPNIKTIGFGKAIIITLFAVASSAATLEYLTLHTDIKTFGCIVVGITFGAFTDTIVMTIDKHMEDFVGDILTAIKNKIISVIKNPLAFIKEWLMKK